MNRRCRSLARHSAPPSEPFLKYLKPGALARLRDSRISARSHRTTSLFQISLSFPPSNDSQPSSAADMDGVPCFVPTARVYGPPMSPEEEVNRGQGNAVSEFNTVGFEFSGSGLESGFNWKCMCWLNQSYKHEESNSGRKGNKEIQVIPVDAGAVKVALKETEQIREVGKMLGIIANCSDE
ncbi:putative beta-1,3-galactosyltransferase 2-like [Hibiscus syriacus]|uniref:Beta-1,3-galactosyltransferase 2-like n=1 Tax=Hibiscus syriacus TaxID=106335 RepID=A0A6A3C773_HIBSY|nr:putative beta-1,3-galactosyltransferase 2-like [Hibiscus syriacus]